jgi:hypothetical protein
MTKSFIQGLSDSSSRGSFALSAILSLRNTSDMKRLTFRKAVTE